MDKNKIIEAAAKLVAKGAYDKAIKEYQKILEVDPKDVRILQKMGELFQKKNDNAQAASYFTRVAESYTNDGFFLKAVALYKQVLKLDPTLLDINLKLAELHQQLQLLSEAMAYFQVVANHYDKAGDTRKSLEVLKKMVDLDPDKVASRVKLADLYVREGMNAEAASEFSRAAEHLKRNNQTDDYVRVAERLSALQPDNLQLAKELAEIYLQRHDQKRALAKLQICFKADNRDIDTLRLLAVAFQGLGQTSKTLSVYKELARAWEEKGQVAEAEQVWAQVAQLDPNDGDVVARSGRGAPKAHQAPPMPTGRHAAQPVQQAAPPPPPPATHSPVPQAAPADAGATSNTAAHQPAVTAVQGAHVPVARPKGDNVAKLLTETDVYVKYGLHDKALEHLRKVFGVEPENIDAHEKAYAIYVASNNHAQAFEQLLNVLRLHTRSGDAERAQPYLQTILQQNPGHPEVPVFVSTLGVGAEAAPSQTATDDGAILVDSNDDDLIVPDHSHDEVISAEVSLSAEEPLGQDVISSGVMVAQADGPDVPTAPPVFGDEPVWGDDPTQGISPDEDPALLAATAGDDESVLVTSADELVDEPELLGGDDEPSTGEFSLAEEPDSAGLTIPVGSVNHGHQAIPFQTIPMHPGVPLGEEPDVPTRVSAQADPVALAPESEGDVQDWSGVSAPTPEPTSLGDGMPQGSGEFSSTHIDPAHFEAAQLDPADMALEASYEEPTGPEEQPVTSPEEEAAGEEVDEATFFLEQGLYEEAREILETVVIAYPGHVRASQLLEQLDAAANAPPAEEVSNGESHAFDLAQELAEELGDEPPPIAPVGPEDYQVSVEEVFAEFKKGLEKVVKPEDVDTHYDLGVAYKEMGLIDDAVSEFTIARKGCIGKRKEVDCLSMTGLLQQLKGDGPAAVDAFMQALTSEHAMGDVEKSLRYDLAGAYEMSGQAGRALNQYLKVQKLDGSFRDVASHVERLSAVTAPEDDAPPPRPAAGRGGGARKVGYV